MKQKILMTYIESGFGHISSMDSICDELCEKFPDKYDIDKSFIMRDEDLPHLNRMERFIIRQVKNTNRLFAFGKLAFIAVNMLGGDHFLRFFHRQICSKAFHEGLEAIKRRQPDIIVTNHHFTNLLAVEYKRRIDPDVVLVNYNPDCTLHTFWDHRDGVFIVNNQKAYKKAIKYKFKPENLRLVTPCVRGRVERADSDKVMLRQKYGLPQDKFTVVVADGGYMLGRGPRFARRIIKEGLPITLCVIAGSNKKLYEEFKAIERGESKLKVSDGMTLKVYDFTDKAYELYGAADLFITKGGPNAVLDSIYMHTPVMINYCPHIIEEWTAKIFVGDHGCGETEFNVGNAIKRIKRFMTDPSDLEKYRRNIDEFIALGNGASAVADIVDKEAAKQRARRAGAGDESGAGHAPAADEVK